MTQLKQERDLLRERMSSIRKKIDVYPKTNSDLKHLQMVMSELNVACESLHIVNGEAKILWANEMELKALGYSADDYIGKSIIDFHVHGIVIQDMLSKLLNRERLDNYPAMLKHKSGKHIHVLINSSGFFKQGKFSHTRCFSRDVTGVIDLTEMIDKNISKIKKGL